MRCLMSTQPAVNRTSRGCLVLGILVAAIMGWLVYAFIATLPMFSAAARLSARLDLRMPISAVQQQAEQLGFVWQVHPTAPEPGASGSPGRDSVIHIDCHERPVNGTVENGQRGMIDVCEEHHLVPSHGMLFASHACQIVFKGGEIEQVWLYSD